MLKKQIEELQQEATKYVGPSRVGAERVGAGGLEPCWGHAAAEGWGTPNTLSVEPLPRRGNTGSTCRQPGKSDCKAKAGGRTLPCMGGCPWFTGTALCVCVCVPLQVHVAARARPRSRSRADVCVSLLLRVCTPIAFWGL